MSTKRIVVITILGILLIAAVIGAMLLASYLTRDNSGVELPSVNAPENRPGDAEPDEAEIIEVSRDTVQAVIATLYRPPVYSREVVIERFWDGGKTNDIIDVYVDGGITSLLSAVSSGAEKNIIVTADSLYIWYSGDREFFTGALESAGDEYRTADEWQMLVTFEDILGLNKNDIISAGYTEHEGELCVYAKYLSPLFGYTRTYYISLEIGLVITATEHDKDGTLIYRMTAGECLIGEANPLMFILPDGTDLLAVN